jgi:type IV secretory pathway TrbL component
MRGVSGCVRGASFVGSGVVTALHFGLSAVVVGVALLAGTWVAVDEDRIAAPFLALGFVSLAGGALAALVGGVDILLFGLF